MHTVLLYLHSFCLGFAVNLEFVSWGFLSINFRCHIFKYCICSVFSYFFLELKLHMLLFFNCEHIFLILCPSFKILLALCFILSIFNSQLLFTHLPPAMSHLLLNISNMALVWDIVFISRTWIWSLLINSNYFFF